MTTKIKAVKEIIIENVDEQYETKVVKSGNTGRIKCRKEHINKKAIVFITNKQKNLYKIKEMIIYELRRMYKL